ncbi:MAG TPA: hypothetical protein H9898_02880 [Candidatus Anaerobiospirillum stercoravium]|nr:hypothetical protein [Candidatus Anaerobiospirillum stercoravium]
MQHLSSKKYEHLMHASEVFDGQNYQTPDAIAALTGSDEVSADEMKRHLKNWSLIGAALRHELPPRIDLNFCDKVMAQLDAPDVNAGIPADVQAQAWVPPIEAERASDLPTMLQGKWSQPGPLQPVPNQQQVAHEYQALVANLKQADGIAAEVSVADFDQAALNRPERQEQVVAQVKAAALRRPKLSFSRSLSRVGGLVGQIAVAASVAVVAVVGVQLYNASQPAYNDQVATTAATQVGPVNGLNLASYQNSDKDLIINPENLPQAQVKGRVAKEQNQEQDLTDAQLRAEQQAELERINLYVQGYMIDTAAAH